MFLTMEDRLVLSYQLLGHREYDVIKEYIQLTSLSSSK